jgi:hypothetical protein
MKLELKHIAPYLPYRLKAKDLITKEIRTVTLLHFTYDTKTVGHNHLIYEGLLLSKHLPILRPLSDLTKEIEVNGEKFVPTQEYSYLRFEEISNYKGGQNVMNFIQVREQNILLELHFDVFGLIEQGLAIDINTLND